MGGADDADKVHKRATWLNGNVFGLGAIDAGFTKFAGRWGSSLISAFRACRTSVYNGCCRTPVRRKSPGAAPES